MTTKLLGIRKPTTQELKKHRCDFVFIREDEQGNTYDIFVNKPCYREDPASWQQWGQVTSILGDNVKDIEDYFNN